MLCVYVCLCECIKRNVVNDHKFLLDVICCYLVINYYFVFLLCFSFELILLKNTVKLLNLNHLFERKRKKSVLRYGWLRVKHMTSFSSESFIPECKFIVCLLYFWCIFHVNRDSVSYMVIYYELMKVFFIFSKFPLNILRSICLLFIDLELCCCCFFVHI